MQSNIRRVPLSRLIFYSILLALVCFGLEEAIRYGWLNELYSELGLESRVFQPNYPIVWLLSSAVFMGLLVRLIEYLQVLRRYEAVVALATLSLLGYVTISDSALTQAGALLGALCSIALLYVGYQNDHIPLLSLLLGLMIGALVWLVDGAYIWLAIVVWCAQAHLNSLSLRHVLALFMGLFMVVCAGLIVSTFDQRYFPINELLYRVNQMYTLSLPSACQDIYTTALIGIVGLGCIVSVRCAYYQDGVRYRDLYQMLATLSALLLVLGILFFGRGTYFQAFALSALTILYGRVMTRIGYTAQIVALLLGVLVLLALIII